MVSEDVKRENILQEIKLISSSLIYLRTSCPMKALPCPSEFYFNLLHNICNIICCSDIIFRYTNYLAVNIKRNKSRILIISFYSNTSISTNVQTYKMRINVIYKELCLLSFLNMNVLNDDTLQISALWHDLFDRITERYFISL